MSPFIPVNKVLLNEDNSDDTETTDTSVSGKDDMLHTSSDGFTEEKVTKTLQIIMTNTRRKLRTFKMVMKVSIILKL